MRHFLFVLQKILQQLVLYLLNIHKLKSLIVAKSKDDGSGVSGCKINVFMLKKIWNGLEAPPPSEKFPHIFFFQDFGECSSNVK